MLSTGQHDGILTKHGYRYLYFAMIFIGPTLFFAILVGFINDGERIQVCLKMVKHMYMREIYTHFRME